MSNYSYAFVGAPITVTGSSGTDDGYDATAIETASQATFWKSTAGGTITIAVASHPAYEIIGMLIVAPNGTGISDLVTTRHYSAGHTLEATINMNRWTQDGLMDRRIIFFEFETWRNDIEEIEIDFPADSEVSYVCMLTTIPDPEAVSVSSPMFRNISDYFEQGWTLKLTPVGKMSDNGGGYFYAEDENLMNIRTLSFNLTATNESNPWYNFHLRKGYHEFSLIVPSVYQHDAADEELEFMHLNSVFGRITGNYTANYIGKNDSDGLPLYNVPVTITEAG